MSLGNFRYVFAEWRVFMDEEDKIDLDVQYYQNKIIETITKCKDLRVLHYLESFNRLYIEKHAKKEE